METTLAGRQLSNKVHLNKVNSRQILLTLVLYLY